MFFGFCHSEGFVNSTMLTSPSVDKDMYAYACMRRVLVAKLFQESRKPLFCIYLFFPIFLYWISSAPSPKPNLLYPHHPTQQKQKQKPKKRFVWCAAAERLSPLLAVKEFQETMGISPFSPSILAQYIDTVLPRSWKGHTCKIYLI